MAFSKKHQYDIDLGSADGYYALPDPRGNYFMDEQGKIILPFMIPGAPASTGWGGGEQATNLGGWQVFPYKIKVRWFSIAENQFWEGSALFDQEKLAYYDKRLPKIEGFIVNYAPGGLVTVWVEGGDHGERFLALQFKAKKTEEKNWKHFIRSAIDEDSSREQYLDFMLNRGKERNSYLHLSDKIIKEVSENRVPGAEHWLRLMKTYPWRLRVNALYELKTYRAEYLNGEQYYAFPKTDDKRPRPVPVEFMVFMKRPNDLKFIRLDFDFDREDMYQKFQDISKGDDPTQPITLNLDINEDMSNVDIDLIKKEQRIRIDKVRVVLRKTPPAIFSVPKDKTLD